MRIPKKCRVCRYRSKSPQSMGICDYLEVTGRARSLLCPPGDGCTEFVKGPPLVEGRWTAQRKRRKRQAAVKGEETLRLLHSQGLSDGEIARQMGVAPNTIRARRQKLGLSANRGPGGASGRGC